MGNRSRAREQALQVLYLIDLTKVAPNSGLDFFRTHFENNDEDYDFVKQLVVGVCDKLKMIDAMIEKYAENWKVSRMPRIDRNILRLGIYQLFNCADIPGAVIIDESVELGKRFGEDKTSAFVNGILDRIFKDYKERVQ